MADSDIINKTGPKERNQQHQDPPPHVHSDEAIGSQSKNAHEDHQHNHRHTGRAKERKAMKSRIVPSLTVVMAAIVILFTVSIDAKAIAKNSSSVVRDLGPAEKIARFDQGRFVARVNGGVITRLIAKSAPQASNTIIKVAEGLGEINSEIVAPQSILGIYGKGVIAEDDATEIQLRLADRIDPDIEADGAIRSDFTISQDYEGEVNIEIDHDLIEINVADVIVKLDEFDIVPVNGIIDDRGAGYITS